MLFSSSQMLAASAAPARCAAARLSMQGMQARSATLGLEATRVQLLLFNTLVDSKLSYGSGVAARRAVISGSSGTSTEPSEPEQLHLEFLRRMLGVRPSTPTAAVLAEAGEPPLYVRWLGRAARFWNRLLSRPADSVERRALEASVALASVKAGADAWASWAAQLAAAVQAVGVAFDPAQLQPLSPNVLQQAALDHHLQRVMAAAACERRTLLRHYFLTVRGGGLTADSYGRPAYLQEVRYRAWWQPLVRIALGVHWGAEDTGRLRGQERQERLCPHCPGLGGPGGIEDAFHMVFDCPLYSSARQRWAELPFELRSLHLLFEQARPEALARFAADCFHTHRKTAAIPDT